MKPNVDFIEARADQPLKRTSKFVSNGAWACLPSVFRTGKRAAQAKCPLIEDDRIDRLIPVRRDKFTKTPFRWDLVHTSIVLFVRETDGARVWLDQYYVDVFGLEEVYGDAIDGESVAVLSDPKKVEAIFLTFIPPEGEDFADLVLRPVEGDEVEGTDSVEEPAQLTQKEAAALKTPMAVSSPKSTPCKKMGCGEDAMEGHTRCKAHGHWCVAFQCGKPIPAPNKTCPEHTQTGVVKMATPAPEPEEEFI